MTREPWMEPKDERQQISGGDRRVSGVSGSFPIRAGSKVDLQEAGRALQQKQKLSEASEMNSDPVTSRHGSMLGSLKAHYRKLRTFKGTVRAIINLKRTPLGLATVVKATSDDQRSAVVEVPRISATAAENVQSQVHKLVAEGHVVAEADSMEVAYRQQGNLDLYTEANLAKRMELQQHPHMIALTQRLWNCALHNDGVKNIKYADYEMYMLCLHRLILPEFDIDASKELIMDDWKRDCGEKDYLDYGFFHLSMFELVDLWTDTVDPEDYISLLYCITHCLTYLLNERHVLKSLEDISNVNILEESKGITQETIEQDLQRELNSDDFAYYRDQIKITTEAKKYAEEVVREASKRESNIQQSDNQTPFTSRSRDHKRVASRSGERDRISANAKDPAPALQHRRSRSGSGVFIQDAPKHKISAQVRPNLTADTSGLKSSGTTGTTTYSINTNDVLSTSGGPPRSNALNHPVYMIPVSPRRQTALQSATSPSSYAPGGVILNIGVLDGTPMAMPAVDDKPAVAISPTTMTGFPRRRSRSASITNQHRRDLIQAAPGKVDNTREASFSGLQVSQIEAPGSVLRAGTQDPNSPGYALMSGASSGISQQPVRVRAAAVAEAAANMAKSTVVQHTQHQLQHRISQYISDGQVVSFPAGAAKNSAFFSNSSLIAPLITIVSSKGPTPPPHETTPLINKTQLQFQESSDPFPGRPQTPYEGLHGTSVSSPRASNVLSAQAAGIFISAQRPVKPPTTPRSTILQSPGTILSPENLAPMSPRKLQQENLSMGANGPGLISTSLTISGRPVAPNNVERPSAGQTPKSEMETGMTGDLPLISDRVASISQLKEDLKSLLSPRYIVTNPVVPHQIPSLKQSTIRPQDSSRGFARRNSPRARHQPSSLANGAATNHLRQQRHPYELQGLSIEPLQLG